MLPKVNCSDPTPRCRLAAVGQRRAGGGGEERPVKQVELDALLAAPEGFGDDVPVDPDFHARRLPDGAWRRASHSRTGGVEAVVQLHRLRDVSALAGFTRFEAAAGRRDANNAPSDGKVCYFSEDSGGELEIMVITARRTGLSFPGLLAAALVLAAGVAVGAASDLRLIDAAARPDAGAVQALLGEGIDVNTARADGVTALLWAAHWDDLDLVELLLGAGADPNAADDHGVTPLMRACENASAPVVRALLAAGADANAAQESGLTALMIAARTGSRDVVRALLAAGADVNATTTETGVTALMWAVEAPHPDIVHVLLETGADVEISSSKGFTALLFAVQSGNVEAARMLLAAGADVNGTGSDATHPLPLAIVSRHADMAYFLLEQGADPNGRIHGVSALHAAAGRVSTWLADWYRRRGMSAASVSGGGRLGLDPESRVPLVRELLARGADPNARIETSSVVLGYLASPRRGAFEQNSVGTGDVRGATPLWVAAFSANGGGLFGDDSEYHFESGAGVLSALVEAGADPNAAAGDGSTPLMMAAGLGYRSYQPHTPRGRRSPPVEEAVRVLVEAGADVNARNEADFTPLHAATFRGLNEVIEYLVEQGADIDARDFRGRTAFRIAEGAKQSFQFQAFPQTAEFLRELGANTRLGIPGTVHERADRAVVEENEQRAQAR